MAHERITSSESGVHQDESGHRVRHGLAVALVTAVLAVMFASAAS